MANNQAADEIDLGQLLALIKKGFNRVGNFFLRLFIYLKRNVLKILGLAILGVVISLVLKNFISETLKTEVIVRPNFESKNYLYGVVEEITTNIKTKNEEFLKLLQVNEADLKGFKINIEPIQDDEVKTEDVLSEETKYLEMLQNLKNESFVMDILKTELSEKSIIDHKITFQYTNSISGPKVVQKTMNYIKENSYFDDLRKVNQENAASRISKNEKLIKQIDTLIADYSNALRSSSNTPDSGMVFMDNENLNVPALFSLKNRIIKEIEEKKKELIEQNSVISVLNMGKTQKVIKPFFNKNIILFPSLLILAFFLFSLLQLVNKKSKELELKND